MEAAEYKLPSQKATLLEYGNSRIQTTFRRCYVLEYGRKHLQKMFCLDKKAEDSK
jgi:hypothetical protein